MYRIVNCSMLTNFDCVKRLGSMSFVSQQQRRKSRFAKYVDQTPPVASDNSNRWRRLVPAFSIHVCLGASYGWSAITGQLTREAGIVSSASMDWSLDAATWPMAIQIASGGIFAALLSSWTVRAGVRKAAVTGSIMFGSGIAISGIGVANHNLGLLYLGNVICGLGYGCAYTPALQSVLDWFPDKRGLASGLVIAGFGSGALAFTPAINSLTASLCKIPTFLGSSLVTRLSPGGVLEAEVDGSWSEIVQLTASEISKLPYSDLTEGYYLVGSGSTGVASSLLILSIAYFSVILTSALSIRRPSPDFNIGGGNKTGLVTSSQQLNVPVENLLRTPQFWLLFSTATLLATGGMALMSVARPMVQEIFTSALPLIVTPTFASLYLISLSVANLSGRAVWAGISDRIGCKATFNILCLSSVPLFLAVPQCITGCITDPYSPLAPFYLGGFCASSFLAVSIMGGVFSVLPPYEAELYGPKYVGAIHGRFLPFSTIRGIVGPAILLHMRGKEEQDALEVLLPKVDPEVFRSTFGYPVDQASLMLETKSLSLSKLASILPAGSDPSAFLYHSSMYTMAGLAMVATLLHLAVKPVDRKYFETPSNK